MTPPNQRINSLASQAGTPYSALFQRASIFTLPNRAARRPLYWTLERMSKKIITYTIFAIVGWFLKIGVIEIERFNSVSLVDACFDNLNNEPTFEEENYCYGAANRNNWYNVISAINFQPMFWKNTQGRCIRTEENTN